MSAFGIGMNMQLQDAGELKGKQREIACDCWFTSKGKTMPRLIKFEDEDGMIQTISGIRVIHSEDKMYCGIKTRVYLCSALKDDTEYFFKLILRKEECRWFLIWI